MMNNETYVDFCFIRNVSGDFIGEINGLLTELFSEIRVNWYLEEKLLEGAEIVVAEVKGMSGWRSEQETLEFLEQNAGEKFWEYLQGYKIYIYPATMRGCNSCGPN